MLEGFFYVKSYSNDNNFSVNENYFSDSESYIKALENGSFCNDNFKSFNVENGKNIEYNDFNSFEECLCVLNGEDIDSLINHNINGDSFYLQINLNLDECSEDFEFELKSLYNYHNRMYKLASQKNDSDVDIDYLPKTDFKFSFKNLSGEFSYVLLSDCTILEYEKSKLFIRVKNLTFIKGL